MFFHFCEAKIVLFLDDGVLFSHKGRSFEATKDTEEPVRLSERSRVRSTATRHAAGGETLGGHQARGAEGARAGRRRLGAGTLLCVSPGWRTPVGTRLSEP